MGTTSLASAVRLFLGWVQANRSAGTAFGYEHYLKLFEAHVGEVQLDECRPIHLLSFRQTFHAVQSVKRFFAWCESPAQLLPLSPMGKIPIPRIGERRRTMTRCQVLRLLRGSCHSFRSFLLGLQETAARPCEVRMVTWRHLCRVDGTPFEPDDLAAGKCLFLLDHWKTKGRDAAKAKFREMPVSPRLGRLLLRLLRDCPAREGYVFRNTLGKAWTANAVRCQMRRLRDRAGLGEKVQGERICNYTFRHTSATSLVMKGAPLPVVKEILGHAKLATTAKYLHPSREDMMLAIRLHGKKKRKRK